MSKITDSAKGEDCTIRLLPHCNRNNETTVHCHINGVRFGHGVANKVDDIHGAYGCSSCHDIVDGRVHSTYYSKDEIKLAHLQGVIETQIKLKQKGLM
jgi:hypothetical protein